MSNSKLCKNLLCLPARTIKTIRDLRVNKKKLRTRIRKKNRKKGTNIRNIVQVPTVDLDYVDRLYKDDNLRFATVNARSLKSKKHIISETMEELKIDAFIVTETW